MTVVHVQYNLDCPALSYPEPRFLLGLPTEKGAGLSAVHVQSHMAIEKGGGSSNCICAVTWQILLLIVQSFFLVRHSDEDSLCSSILQCSFFILAGCLAKW